jgi:uncharacterized protein DUF3618
MYLMADRDSQAQLRAVSAANGTNADGTAPVVTGTVAPSGKASRRDSDDIVAEIERTRENLARTIDSLADRVSPAGNARRLRERATGELAKPEVQLAVAAVVLAVTGLMVYRIWGRRSR